MCIRDSRSSVLDARANSHSWNDFFCILKGLGIDMRFNHAENSDKIRGISFSQDVYKRQVVYLSTWLRL